MSITRMSNKPKLQIPSSPTTALELIVTVTSHYDMEKLSIFPVILPTRWRAAHMVNAAVTVALEVFPQHVVSLDSDIKSLSCSLGLSPRAYFV